MESPYIINILRLVLKKEFPFIIDIRTGEVSYSVEGALLLSAYVDVKKMASIYNVPISSYIRFFSGVPITRCFLSTFADGYGNEIIDKVQKEIEQTVKTVQCNPAIPNELKTNDYIILTQYTSI